MKLNKILPVVLLSLFLVKSVLSQQLVSVSATQLQPGHQAGYKFVINTSQVVSPTASFAIIFPQQFFLERASLCGSKTLNGGLTMQVNQDTVRIQRSGLGTEQPAGEIDLFVGSIVNPDDMEADYEFQIYHYENNRQVSAMRKPGRVVLIQ
ncbi:MAG TPA: hypothetical protein PLP19_03615 [bacterium]|nr:hypothetical protein [bacterium]HPN42555.1 hypothetical protein [bacterium]